MSLPNKINKKERRLKWKNESERVVINKRDMKGSDQGVMGVGGAVWGVGILGYGIGVLGGGGGGGGG